VIEIFEKPGPVPGFDLLTWAGSWAQEKPRKVKKCLGLDSGYRKTQALVQTQLDY